MRQSLEYLQTGWGRFGTSIFSVMTQKALAAEAVNLAQGFPDFDGPDVIKEAAIAAIRGGQNQYAPAAGLPALRTLLAARQQQRYGLAWDPDTEVTVLSGATEAIWCTFLALLQRDDEILTFEPCYDSYPAAAFAAGARLVGVPLRAPDFTFDPDELQRAVTPRTRAIIVNTPHNPTGRVLTASEMTLIRDLAVRHDLLVITDEVYEELVFDGRRHLSLAAMDGMRDRTVTISSTSKTFSMTGWKVGYTFAPKQLTDAIRAVHQFTVFCSATPLQAGMTAALQLGDDYFRDLRSEYDRRRILLLEILQQAGFKPRRPEGTYFVLADYAAWSEQDDLGFAGWLTSTAQVAAIPVSVFYGDPQTVRRNGQRYVRFAFCKNEATIRAAATNLNQAWADVRPGHRNK